jgi:hypothetical protein
MTYFSHPVRTGAARSLRLLLRVTLITLPSVSCRSSESVGPSSASVASVSLAPASIPILKGSHSRLTLSARDSAGNELSGARATWTTSASDVATVSSDGVVTGVGYGSATITASIGTHSAPADIVVTAAPTVRSYSVLDLGEGNPESAVGRHLSDSGDVLTGPTGTLYRHGVATTMTGCVYPITLNGPGHVLCSNGKGDSVSSYAIWRDGALSPVAAADTFVAQHFRAFAMNDSDEVAGLFFMPSFLNANCPATGVRCLSVWKNGVPTFPGYDAGGSDVMLMNNKRQAVVEYAQWAPDYGMTTSIYDIPTGKSRSAPYGVRAFNDNGWGAITWPWLAHGSSNPFRATAYVTTPSSFVTLGDGAASGINASNVVVGTLSVGPFIWRGDGVSLLVGAANDATWTITGAGEINDRGQILASADNSDGRKAHIVLLTPSGP